MIEILEFKGGAEEPLVRLGCSCGDPRLAAYRCEGDQIIYCTHCGEITSRDRLRNEATIANQSAEWKWENVVDRDDCPLVNVSIPVKVFIDAEGDTANGHAGCVTKISTDHCFMRLDVPSAELAQVLATRRPLKLDVLSEFPPLAELTACDMLEVVHPHGDAGPAYYKLKLQPRSRRQFAELKDFYQTACGLRFDWQVLVYSDPEHSSALRRMLVECLPMARIEVAVNGTDFIRLLREKAHNLFILPPVAEYMKLIKSEAKGEDGREPVALALVRQRTAGEISNALLWGARDILHYDCDMSELRNALQRCLEQPARSASSALHARVRKNVPRNGAIQDGVSAVSPGDEETIQLLLMASETHDPHISNHLKRIAAYCGAISKVLGWDGDRIAQLATASKLHDVGKIGVPDDILRKTGALTHDERKVMQQHTRFGHHILQAGSSGLLRLASTIALRHHERQDGRGYPDGLAAEAIPIEAQIVSVADVFDALTTARPYKPAWPNERAIDYLRENKGHMFAPVVVEAFLEGLPEIRKSQLAFLDDFRDVWTERRRHDRHPISPVGIEVEIAMPEQTFRPFRLVGHLTNISEGGVKAKICNVTGDLFSMLVSTRRYGKLHCEDANWKELDNLSCEVVWIDYYAVPDPNACIMGINFHRERPNLLDTLRSLAQSVVEQAIRKDHPLELNP